MGACRMGLAKVEITPRVGVELQGYGPFLCRHSDGVRDPLYARALAVEAGGERALVVSCDLIGVSADITGRARELLQKETGIPPERVLVHAIHTHSGPALRVYGGWGTPDPPYLELLPLRIAAACREALARLQPAQLFHAEVPCTGIATNRETDLYKADPAEAMKEDWQPPRPELTDATCHVFAVRSGEQLLGFLSSYGCHPVIGGSSCRKIHGDWPGVATNLLERLHPGSVGLFLQGAQGDINACVVGESEAESLRVLDVVAARYARRVVAGLRRATPLHVDCVRAVRLERRFSRKISTREELAGLLAEQERILPAADASDAQREVRMAMVRALALRELIERLDRGEDLSPPVELHGVRLGPLALLGSPFEVFRAIKNDVAAGSRASIPLVMGLCNDSLGYAVDRDAAARGGYAADQVPFICRQLPYADIHSELVEGLLELDAALFA